MRRARAGRRAIWLAKGALLFLGCSQALARETAGGEIIFPDSFESGGACAWSRQLGWNGECPCGNLTLLRDSFDTAGAGPYFESWNDVGTSVSESGGQLVVDVGANVDGYAGYESLYSYDLHGGWMDAAVAEVAGSETVLEVRNHLGNAARIVKEGSDVIAALTGVGQLASRPWNPAERYWRISEDEGEMVWAVSSDRQSWDELHRLALPFDVAHVRGVLAAGGSSGSPSQARFDDVNAGPPLGVYCAADTLQDDFATAPLLPPWEPYADAGCSVAESGGELALTYTNGTGSVFCGLGSLHLYDAARGDGVTVDGTGLPSIANFVGYIRTSLPGASERNGIETSLEGNFLEYRLWVNGAITGQSTLAIDRKLHRYWRMRGEGATAIFETSDGTGFIERWRVSAPFQLTPVDLDIGAGHYDAVTVPLTVTLPGVNAD